MSFRAALLALFLPLLPAAGEVAVYFAPGTPPADLAKQTSDFRKTHPQEELRYVPLRAKSRSITEAEQAAAALEAGVTSLPSAVVTVNGMQHALPLRDLTEEKLQQLAAQPTEEAIAQAAQRRYRAALYYLTARMALRQEPNEIELAQDVAECRRLLKNPAATEQDKQLVGLRCLYPLLMQQYALGYTGAHTPATEAKLLEAIAALEAARDANPESKEGKAAHDERERLRMARRQARQCE